MLACYGDNLLLVRHTVAKIVTSPNVDVLFGMAILAGVGRSEDTVRARIRSSLYFFCVLAETAPLTVQSCTDIPYWD